MAYATTANIVSELSHITISATSNPTETEVTAFIAEIEAEMDVRFNAVGIVTPIATPANALSYAKQISINGSSARTLRSVDKESEAAVVYRKLFDNAMKTIEKNPRIMQAGQTFVAPGSYQDTARPGKYARTGDLW
jgi:hypothetical protein|tara:strand:- start:22615 stop:23022 length:408 start_codon:yes stop_codon:yes gene_type:complete